MADESNEPTSESDSSSVASAEAPGEPAPRSDNPYSTLLAILGGGVALALAILAIGFITRDGGGGGGEGDGGGGVAVSLTEFAIDGNLNAPPGASLDVTNDGSQVHNLVIDGGGSTSDLDAGASETLGTDGLADGDYTVYCSIPGHREAGMEATLKLTEGAEVAAGDSAADSHAGANPDYQQQDQDMLDSFTPFVDQVTTGVLNTEGMGGQPLEPTMDPDGYKRFELTAEITKWEVEPGKIVDAWTYNGTVPGPTIRVNVGDKVRIHFINKLPLGSDIHLHGARLPNDMDGVAPITQPLVQSGETFDYEFVAEAPATAMYHPHAHGYEGIPNGLWGAFLISADTLLPRGQTVSGVEIPADLTPAIDDIMNLNDAGVIGLSLNGKSFPGTTPYSMKVGEWANFTYYNEGLQIHPMHLHQFPQLVYARDGIPLEQPYWVDTLMVAPGERYSVLFQADRPGVWVWHCHILTHAERETGMFGMVTAIEVTS